MLKLHFKNRKSLQVQIDKVFEMLLITNKRNIHILTRNSFVKSNTNLKLWVVYSTVTVLTGIRECFYKKTAQE